tara:strand:- start:1024 stop:1422 length:399 start_codon:yes stop_codon:yes gene_type:complete
MTNLSLQQVIESSDITVHPGRYAYLKCQTVPPGNHFMVTQDPDEVTVISKEIDIPDTPHIESTQWWKLLEIRVSMPFTATGFLAKITSTVATKDLNILIVSTYSKDYVLVREDNVAIATQALRDIGFPIRTL